MSWKEGKHISTAKKAQQAGEMFWDSEAHNAVQLWNAENNSQGMAWQIATWEAGSSLKDGMYVASKWFLEFEQVGMNMLYSRN